MLVKFTEVLWESIAPIWEKIKAHPFLCELVDGTLNKQAFDFYIVQDYLYLREFGKGLAMIAVKADTSEQSQLFLTHAANIFKTESALHLTIFRTDHISETHVKNVAHAPNCLLYIGYLMKIAHERPFYEIIATFLPCYWIYWEVGKLLKSKGSKEPNYQKWIDTYSSEEYGEGVRAVIAIMDHIAEALTEAQRQLLIDHFAMTSKMEYMFWDMGYTQQQWPI